jgi:hypothetical protein
MKISKKYILSELKEFKRISSLLCKGKGTFADYLLMSLVSIVSLSMGYWIWGV